MDNGPHPIDIFWSDEDGCYVADIPDFEYCAAFGNAPGEAPAEFTAPRQLWVEAMVAAGRKVPEPRDRPGDLHTAA